MTDLRVLPATKPLENRRLSSGLELPHSAAFYFVDHLAGLVVAVEEAGLSTIHLPLQPGEEIEIEDLSGERLWEWLRSRGYEAVLRDHAYVNVALALIADMSHFLHESLVCAAKQKMTVAFSLIRKPFKESLFHLEWMLAEPDAFLDAFRGESLEDRDWSRQTRERRRSLISRALIAVDAAFLDGEFIFDVRYSKHCGYGLEPLWQKATHLVTTMKGIETEPENFNFVFSASDAIEEQQAHYYCVVPMLACYSLLVAETVVARFASPDPDQAAMLRFLHQLAFCRYAEASDGSDSTSAVEIFGDLVSSVRLTCENCHTSFPLADENLDRLWSSMSVMCPTCRSVHELADEVFPRPTGEGRPS